jgi:hypothetical protein
MTRSFKRHLVLQEGAAEAMALWVVFSGALDNFNYNPRLALLSPMLGCGKTTALEVVKNLVNRPIPCSNATGPVIFRVIEAGGAATPTLLFDEADTYLRGDDEGMKGILNSGHSRTAAYVLRCNGEDYEPRAFSTWAPMLIAKIGSLPAVLESRSIVITMNRKRPQDAIKPIQPEDVRRLEKLASKVVRWVEDHKEALWKASSEVPAQLFNRAADNWKPLAGDSG